MSFREKQVQEGCQIIRMYVNSLETETFSSVIQNRVQANAGDISKRREDRGGIKDH